MDDLDDCLYVEFLEKMENRKRRKVQNQRKNDLFEKDESEFLRRYRISKASAREILTLIGADLSTPKYPSGLTKEEQLLIALRFYASGTFQINVGDLTDTSQSTVSKTVCKVSRAIASQAANFIVMPTSRRELEEVSNDFYAIANFPGVIGCIDCSHVKISSPGGTDAERFRCRKGFFSLNVQTVIDANLFIRHVVARWPGSVHDSTIFNNSSVRTKFENGDIPMDQYHLLGDSGYALKPYMMTPIMNASTLPEERYNKSQIKTRNAIERKYGVLKRRFPCLALGLRNDVPNIPPIITACCVLHNLAVKNGDPEPPLDKDIADLLDEAMNVYSSVVPAVSRSERQRSNAGNAKRNLIISKCFV